MASLRAFSLLVLYSCCFAVAIPIVAHDAAASRDSQWLRRGPNDVEKAVVSAIGEVVMRASGATDLDISNIPDIDNLESLKKDFTTPVDELNRQISPTLSSLEVRSDSTRTSSSCSSAVRIVAYNAERGKTWKESCEKLKTEQKLSGLYILLLNEMDNGMARTQNQDTSALLAQCLGMDYVYGVEFVELTDGQSSEKIAARDFGKPSTRSFHGNCIMSKLPLRNFEIIRLPGTEEYWHKGGFDNEFRLGGRMAIFASLPVLGADGIEDGSIELVSTHLDAFVGDEYNERSMKLIAQTLEKRGSYAATHRAIVAGDFGSHNRKSSAADYLVSTAHFMSTEKTHASDCHLCSGDWIMLRGLPAVTGKNAVSSQGLSDHNFLSLDLSDTCA